MTQMKFDFGETREDKVHEFHEAFGVKTKESYPCWSLESLGLRIKLIEEEFKELKEAVFTVRFDPHRGCEENMVKEMADLQYVLSGMADILDINLEEAFDRVHQSNMSKLGEDGKPVLRDDGKVLKGPNYKEPYLGDLV